MKSVCCWFTFDLQVSGTLGVGGGVRHLARHGHFTVVQDEGVFASLLDDVNVLSNNATNSHQSHTGACTRLGGEFLFHSNIKTMGHSGGAHRGRTEDFSVQLPLAVDVILRDLHLETSRLSVKQLHAVNRPDNLDVTSWWERKQNN